MGRAGITLQDVSRAIAELQGAQRNITIDNIRDVLGSGSNSTILKHLNQLKSTNAFELNVADNHGMPAELIGIVKGLWSKLHESADDKINSYKQEYEDKKAEIENNLSVVTKDNNDLKDKVHQLEEDLHSKQEQIKVLQASLVVEEKNRIKAEEQAASQALSKQEMKYENEKLHKMVASIQNNLVNYQAESQKLREEQLVLIEKQRGEYEQKIAELNNKLAAANTDKANYAAKLEQSGENLNLIEAKYSTLDIEHNNLNKDHESLKAKYEVVEKNHDGLNQELKVNLVKLTNSNAEVNKLESKLQMRDDKLTDLNIQLSSANDKIDSLRHEYQFTLQEKANLEGQFKQLQEVLSNKSSKNSKEIA